MRLGSRDLLNSAVGRHMCLAYVESLVNPNCVQTDLGPAENFSKALKTAAMVIDLESGASSVIGWDVDGQLIEQENFLVSLKHEAEDLGVLGPEKTTTLAHLLDQIPLGQVDELTMMQVLASAVGQMHFWGQDPAAEERLAADPRLRKPLARIAEHIVASDATNWWYEPWSQDEQWIVRSLPPSVEGNDQTDSVNEAPIRTLQDHETMSVLIRDAFEVIEAERESRGARYSNPDQKFHGVWWSFPPYELEKSTRSIPGIGPVAVYCEEDGRGESTKLAYRVKPVGNQIFEIRDSEDWALLCALYPNDVSATRLDMWQLNTGRRGRWVIPDWLAMSNDFDGVHLTVAAYIALAGNEIPVPELDFSGDWSSSVVGWTPDWTFYFTPVVADPSSVQRWAVQEGDNELERWESIAAGAPARSEEDR